MADRTVMLVGQDESLLTGVSDHLRQHGFEAVIFKNFESARQYLHVHLPGALVTEIPLGQFNGLHLVLLAHGWSPTTASFVYSADRNVATREEAEGCGAVYLHKDDIGALLVPRLLETLAQNPVY